MLQAFRNGSTRIQHKNNIWLVFSNQEHSQKHNLGRKREHHILLMFIQCMQLKKKRTISGKFCLDLELLREYQSPFATIVTIPNTSFCFPLTLVFCVLGLMISSLACPNFLGIKNLCYGCCC